jgi:hypothetical protein
MIMLFREPVILLVFYICLPIKAGYFGALVAQVLLSQIRAIQIARQTEKQLEQAFDLDDDDQPFNHDPLHELLTARWVDPSNAMAQAYCELLINGQDLIEP